METTAPSQLPITFLKDDERPNVLGAAAARSFMYGGRARFTLLNPETTKRFTYCVRAPKKQRDPGDPVHFADWMNGTDNVRDYVPIGMVRSGSRFLHVGKAGILENAPSVLAFRWLVAALHTGDLRHVLFIHAGRCGCCSRELTDPESIAIGLGPECRKKLGLS